MHADGLRLRLGLNRLLNCHGPLLLQHGLGHALSKGGAHSQLGGQCLRPGQQVGRFVQAVEKTPGQALGAGHGPPGEEQLGRPALPDDARQQGARSHVGPGQADAGEQKSGLGGGSAQAHVAGQRHHGASASANAINRPDDRLRAVAHGLDEVTRHAGELQHLGHAHGGEGPDDLVHIAAGAKVVARAGDHHHFHIGGEFKPLKQVAQLGIRLKGKRVLAIRAVQGDGAHAVREAPDKMPGHVASGGDKLAAHRVGCANKVFHAVSRGVWV